MQGNVAIVDDEEVVSKGIAFLLNTAGFLTRRYLSAEDFLTRFEPGLADCLVVDLRMPGMGGLALLDELDIRKNGIPVILISGHMELEELDLSRYRNIVAILDKPLDETAFLAAVQEGVRRPSLENHRSLA
jgi:FixJ family two-component response regulator